MHPRDHGVNRPRPWLKTPRRPIDRTPGDGHSRWTRIKEFLKAAKVVIYAIAGAISGLSGYVAVIDRDRHARLATIQAAISALQHQESEAARRLTLDSLGASGLAEHLEPHALQGLQNFIQNQTRLSTACAPPTSKQPSSVSPRADVNHAFRLIATLQAPTHTRHAYPDRVIDAFLRGFHGESDPKVTAFALDGTDLRGDSLGGVAMRSASLVGACLTGTHFDRTILDSARFDRAVLDGADFTRASLRSSSFVDAHADGAGFDHADLTDANLNGATLRRARFFAANLSCATLGNARLDSAYFSTAIARWALFGGAKLAHVREWEEIADFTGTFVVGVRGLPDTLLSLAHARGAVPDSTNQARWSEVRSVHLRPGGACAGAR